MKTSRGKLNLILLSLIVPLSILLLWEFSVRSGFFPNTLVASPSQVVSKFVEMLLDGRLTKHSYVSMRRVFFGFTLGTSFGVVLGIIVGYWKLGAKLIEPTLLALLPVPPLAWIPFLIIVFGIDETSKVALIAMGSFWTLFLETSFSIRAVDKKLIEVAQIFKKDWRTILKKVMIPAILPNLFSAMRVALAISWGLMVASEIIASSEGLGWLIWDARNFSRPADLIVGMIATGILGKLSDSLLVRIERHFTKWRTTYRDM